MLTAQRFQLSVLAGGEAERWPPISLNTRSQHPSARPPPHHFLSPSPSSIPSSPFLGVGEGERGEAGGGGG